MNFEAKGNDVRNHMELERMRRMNVKEEIKIWFDNYEEISKKCTTFQKQFPEYRSKGKWSRVRKKAYTFCQKVVQMMDEINTHYEKAKNFELTPTNLPPPNVEIGNIEFIHGLRSIEKCKKVVYEALKEDFENVIGLWGMGGIGKTTLMHQINNEMANGSYFKHVIMVTVSGNLNIAKIQDQIERRVHKKYSGDSTKNQPEAARAYTLSELLKKQGSILIIFDDVWEPLDFTKIGIPKNKLCKIVLTTRKQNVCIRMGAKEIKMDALEDEDSWKMFEEINVGQNKVVDAEVKTTAHDVCKECAGLPLAISIVSKSLKNETDVLIWRETLKFLKESNPQGVDNLEKEVYNPLRLSYDRLERNDLKDCFLICSLFPEDHTINLFDLICYGIGVGIPWATSKKGIESYDAFLNLFKQLKSRGLLQDIYKEVRDESRGKMHDVVRDVAINIAKEEGFFIKTGVGFTNWTQLEEEDLKGMKWISLMENSIKDITYQAQNIQGVEFLSLNGNKKLKSIHSDFFEGIQNLLLMDLRETSMSELTPCIHKVKKLRVLMYEQGNSSEHNISIPIKELLTLQYLSVLCLQKSYIPELDEEFGTLVHLRVIDFSETSIDIIRPKVFSSLQKLEVLFMIGSFRHWKASDEEDGDCVAFKELATLMHLYALHVDIEDEYIISDKYTSVECFPSVKYFSYRSNFERLCYQNLNNKHLALKENTQNIAKWLKILLEKTSTLRMCVDCRYLVDAPTEPKNIMDIHNLESIYLENGSTYKNVIQYSSNTEGQEPIGPILPNLKLIVIGYLNSLDTIIANPSLLPHGSFQGLVEIAIYCCNDMRFVFTWSMAQCLVQLRWLNIQNCAELKHIIGNDNCFDCHMVGQELFSKIERMFLFDLPKLENVWQKEETQENIQVQWSSMKYLDVAKCKNLNPLFFYKQSAPALECFNGDKEFFHNLIWEDEETKNIFTSLFRVYDPEN